MKPYLYLFVWLFERYKNRKPTERQVTTNLAITLLIQLNILWLYFISTIDFEKKLIIDRGMTHYYVSLIFFILFSYNYFYIIRQDKHLLYKEQYYVDITEKRRIIYSVLIIVYIIFTVITSIGTALYASTLR